MYTITCLLLHLIRKLKLKKGSTQVPAKDSLPAAVSSVALEMYVHDCMWTDLLIFRHGRRRLGAIARWRRGRMGRRRRRWSCVADALAVASYTPATEHAQCKPRHYAHHQGNCSRHYTAVCRTGGVAVDTGFINVMLRKIHIM